MATITLRAPLKERVGDSTVTIGGSTITELLTRFEREHPQIKGWVLDEQGNIRRHVNVFLNGERTTGPEPVDDKDEIHIIGAISGGST